jgi:hypothetical protein
MNDVFPKVMQIGSRIGMFLVRLSVIALVGMTLSAEGIRGRIPGASAQSELDFWGEPVNLSRSGAALDPLLIRDVYGEYHVFWRDEFLGVIYSHGDGNEWNDPEVISAPFGTYLPIMETDRQGLIHAFWLDELNTLYYSQVHVSVIRNPASWSTPVVLAQSAVAIRAKVDSDNHLHLVYARPLEEGTFPAGIYYRKLADGSRTWSNALPLFTSPYFRSLTRANARLSISTASTEGNQYIYVGWDNQPRERVTIIRSMDGGENWGAPTDIDQRIEGTVASGPSDLELVTWGHQALLIWQSGHTDTNCQQFFQVSYDGGESWEPRQRMLDNIIGCPRNNQLLELGSGGFLLMTVVNEQAYLMAWDGSRWSSPQLQRTLTSFIDSETQRSVDYDCRQAHIIDGSRIVVVGCDRGAGRDIWLLQRPLPDISEWFPQATLWNPSRMISRGLNQHRHPVIVVEGQERIHAIWSHPEDWDRTGYSRVLFYSRMEGGQWSDAQPALKSAEGKAEDPAGVLHPSGQLVVVWSGGINGEIYSSTAPSSQGLIASAWTHPELVPSPRQVGSSPDILVDHEGTIFVVYAIPLNEDRGIYLTRSTDAGASWTQPSLVFDGVSSEWAMVDNPLLAKTLNGHLHVMWNRQSLPTGPGSLGLFYARSDDGGETWSDYQMVVENPTVWSKIVGFGDQTVHRVWQEHAGGRTTLWHEISYDSGMSWERTAPVSIFGETVGVPSLAMDSGGRIHLLQLISQNQGNYLLQHWFWDGERWSAEQNLGLDSTITALESMEAVFYPPGNLLVFLSASAIEPVGGRHEERLIMLHREIEVPELLPTPVPAVIAVPTPTITTEPTPIPTPIPTAVPESIDQATFQDDIPSVNNRWMMTIAGPIAAGLIVLVVLVVGARSGWFWNR